MKRYRLIRNLSAEKASQKEAEQIFGRRINNLLYGTEGYIIEENGEYDWMPKSVFDSQAVLVDKAIHNYQYLKKEATEAIAYLKEQYKKTNCQVRKNGIAKTIKRLEALIKDVSKLIDYEITDV